MQDISLEEVMSDSLSLEDDKDACPLVPVNEDPADPQDPQYIEAEYARVQSEEEAKMLRPAAQSMYTNVRNELFKTFQDITKDEKAWASVPSPNEDEETLQLYTSRAGLEDTGFCYWRVTGRVEISGDHLYILLSDYWPRTRLSWDKHDMKNVRIVESFPQDAIVIVQTLRNDAPKGVTNAGGTLGMQWKRFNPRKSTWTVLFHSIRQHRHVDPSPPMTCRGMGETWTAAHIRENPRDGSSCNIDIVAKVWAPVPSEKRVFGRIRRRDEESLRQRFHYYEQVQKHWFKHFPPGLVYGSNPPCNTLDDASP